MKKFFKEFGAFIRRGNVLDLAVGIIIGGAFQAIVRSLVNDIIMPIIGVIAGTSVKDAKLVLVNAVTDNTGSLIKPAVTLNYGAFIQAIIDFLIIALTIFVIIKVVQRMQDRVKRLREQPKEEVVIEPISPKPTTEELLTDIRDLLAKKESSQTK